MFTYLKQWAKTVTGELGYMILSHEFTTFEKSHILEQLTKNKESLINHLLW